MSPLRETCFEGKISPEVACDVRFQECNLSGFCRPNFLRFAGVLARIQRSFNELGGRLPVCDGVERCILHAACCLHGPALPRHFHAALHSPGAAYARNARRLRFLAWYCRRDVALAHCWWATHPVFHSTQLAAPWIAYATKWVSIFAVLSGFLIYRSGLKAIQKSGDASRLWHPKTIPHLSGVCAWRSALPCTRAIQRKCQHQPSILLLL